MPMNKHKVVTILIEMCLFPHLPQLSDLLLLCSPRLGGRVIHGPQHRLRARYNVENLHVVEGDNLETANTFYIRDASKTVELYTQ